MTYFEAMTLFLAQDILLCWAVIVTCFVVYNRSVWILVTSFRPWRINMERARRKRNKNEISELQIIKKDLEERVVLLRLRSDEDDPAAPLPTRKLDVLLQNGIALNQSLSQRDTDHEKRGDHWLSGYRWFWFMVYQLLIGLPIAALFSFAFLPPTAALIGFWFSFGTGFFFGAMIVPEKFRGRIARFGGHVSFLHTGLQFRVPLFEVAEAISLKNMVWGPGKNTSDEVAEAIEYHLKGATGSDLNPHPGVLLVSLRGTYNITVTIKITLRIRRADRHAWYWWAYEFANRTEVGEVIADVTHAILSTRAREIDETTDATGNVKEVIGRRMRKFLDSIPEITGAILLTLYEMSRERLGGLLPISVAITSVDPPKEFTDLLLRLDTADVSKEEQSKAGEGRAARWSKSARGVARLLGIAEGSKLPEDIVRGVVEDDILLEVAQQPTIDAWFRTKILPGFLEVLKQKPPK